MNCPILSIILLITTPFIACSQVFHASDTYANGRKKFKGKFVVCSTRDERVPFVEIFEKRKFGKWIAYNPNGTIKEIRYYTKKGKDCKTPIQKTGEWKYFNNSGILYLTEKYDNDTLIHSAIDVYEGSLHLGTALRTHMGLQKIPLSRNRDTSNLIMNPSFDQYLFKPVEIINDGKDQIENLIPYWYSPDGATPDYFNDYRSVAGMPGHIHSTVEGGKNNGYIGLMLYLGEELVQSDLVSGLSSDPESGQSAPDYNESIQAKLATALIENRTYCLRMSILLSKNAGYSVNRFGILFSDKPASYSYLNAPTKPTLSFTSALNNYQEWTTLCKAFVARGGEAYITLGRFSGTEDMVMSRHKPAKTSELDVNRSAYYLIDDLRLYEVETPGACGCNADEPVTTTIQKPTDFEMFDENQLLEENRFLLSNILFDFDKAEIKQSFIPELNKLLSYLMRNTAVSIMIKAFTDNEGTDEYNLELSRKRAESIARWLIESGIGSDRISAEGYGSSDPIVDNATDVNRAMNRRVEIVLIGK